MKSKTIFVISAFLLVSLILSSPQETEGALLDDLLMSADRATAFFQGAHAAPDTAAELAAEAAEPKEPGEVEREAAKTPDELADEALEAARDGEL